MRAVEGVIVWAMPFLYLLGFCLARLPRPIDRRWALAEAAAAMAGAFAFAHAALQAWRMIFAAAEGDVPGTAMMLLVGLLGWVVVRYSGRYLNGEPRQDGYRDALLATLAAVSAVAVSDHLGVLLLAWTMSSLGLHRLLTFYRERPGALMAAHKKFIASRIAECCMAIALLLIWGETGSLSLAAIGQYVENNDRLPAAMQAAALLIAVAVIFKSAQLPVHGWLIQVMEAPTPVSALLHAGVVNLGGFVLIRLAELIGAAPAAQTMLVIVGGATAVLAGLVTMTRVSIKVRLAWSTCAQMGFMLMECGLGLYELALLHLLAHSLYKAYAFLTAGEAVLDARYGALLARRDEGGLASRIAAVPLGFLLVFIVVSLWQAQVPAVSLPPAAWIVLGFGVAPLLWRTSAPGRLFAFARGSLVVVGIVHLYLLWHLIFDATVHAREAAPTLFQTLWVGACFTALYGLQVWVLAHPAGRMAKRLYPWAYAGFHLDETFTRLTFRVWPLRMTQDRGSVRRPGTPLPGDLA